MQKFSSQPTLRPIGQNKKGSVSDIGPVALAVGVAVIIVAMVTLILAEINDNVSNANATTVLEAGLEAMIDFSDWFAIIVVVAVAVIILGLVMLLRRYSGGTA